VYNPNTNPTVLNEFASAAMRFGHSMINSLFKGRQHVLYHVTRGRGGGDYKNIVSEKNFFEEVKYNS
jgi:hypothetical protein